MAGFGDATMAAHEMPPAPNRLAPPFRRALPCGPCNHRNAAAGKCGCEQFWDKHSAELHGASDEGRAGSERSTWCVCGHHACFHLQAPPAAPRQQPSAAESTHRACAKCDGQCQLPPASQPASPRLGHATSYANAPGLRADDAETPSHTTAVLPRVPSVCLLSQHRRPAAAKAFSNDLGRGHAAFAGLGLSMVHMGGAESAMERASVSPTIPDESVVGQLSACHSEVAVPPTRANSAVGEREQVRGQTLGAIDPNLDFNRNRTRNLHLDMGGDTIPNTYDPADFLQSATEVATPSNAGTPDLSGADQAVRETKKLLETLTHLTSSPDQQTGSDGKPNSATSVLGPQSMLANSPTIPHERLRNALRSASPQALTKLTSYLGPLHHLLNSIPNVASSMRDVSNRLDLLENRSFNYIQPEDIQHQYDMFDGRMLELEHRMDDHDKVHQAIDADESSSSTRRHVGGIKGPFASNHSMRSSTSSALVLGAVDPKELDPEFGDIKDRLDALEAVAVPTLSNPWEVEVVFLPWGRHLHGIWYCPDESLHDISKATTQNSEEWTQARMPGQHSGPSVQLRASQRLEGATGLDPGPTALDPSRQSLSFQSVESGWSSEAISEWASTSSEEWLFPKGCGSNNLVYKRLRSRGFVRDIKFRSAGARDIQLTLSAAFKDLLGHLGYTDKDQDPPINSYAGLRALFIPLRKVIKDPKLHFLSPAEMSSSALWSAQFLASGVMMRVSGGKKRLYVTQREAYLQPSDYMGDSWTWQDLRQLPRVLEDSDSQMEGNYEHCQPKVPEGNAKETCWSFYEPFDAPPVSVTSSFSSHHSVELSMRPADRQWRRSITPSSILKNKHAQPISPLSENRPPAQPGYNRTRTVSTSIIQQAVQGSSKRRFNSSPVKPSLTPYATSRAPSTSVTRPKRRRVTQSSSPREVASDNAPVSGTRVAIWNTTPRRSREAASPFFCSHPDLPRTNSDVLIAVVGKSTPFPYATPHSGAFVGGPASDPHGAGGGDTEVDDDLYPDDDEEKSWRGVTTGSDDDSDAGEGAEIDEPASFSGDESGFGSEDDDDDGHDGEVGPGHQSDDDGEDNVDEDGDEVFDTLLGVLQH
ncbi:hypothetical protein BDV95DRAFT_229682 [Massariosphaeria phaeospora]|uniref:Uncharacterized protein n=1 Tax=Massariosphaeria phaeospora TaxID=100035 RepID=A0A7C8MGV7_9PLEO|nr:hypothetical protein BDV95DRAFT_229682 [Massariosphaeria phaeospora]